MSPKAIICIALVVFIIGAIVFMRFRNKNK